MYPRTYRIPKAVYAKDTLVLRQVLRGGRRMDCRYPQGYCIWDAFARQCGGLAASLRFSLVDSDWPMVTIELDAAEVSKVAEVLVHLAALIDPDGIPPLRDAFGGRLDEYALKDEQFGLLSHDPGHASADRAEYAAYLRTIWTKIEDQLPPRAPEIRLGGPRGI